MTPEVLEVAPVLIFSAVRASAAVAGIPPKIPEAMFAKAVPSISRGCENSVFVIRSAILALISVSRIAIAETATDALNMLALKKLHSNFGIETRLRLSSP